MTMQIINAFPGERTYDASAAPTDPATFEEILDQTLRLAADHHRTLGQRLGRQAFSPSIAELRQSPLGWDLRLLAEAAEVESGEVRAAAERVRETLLRPMAGDDYEIPAWFWASELGRVVARAERIAAGEGGWLPPAVAALSLGMAEDEVLEWAAIGMLAWLPDEAGRPLISLAAVERMRVIAMKIGPARKTAPRTADHRLSA
ncbi:MAG: hypothetical protein ACR2J8_01025 [Thermomicrobiales bacterium]